MIGQNETRDKIFDIAKGISILLMTITHLNLSKWINMIGGISSLLVQCSRASFFILAFQIVIERKIVNPLVNMIPVEGTMIDITRFLIVIAVSISLYRAMFFTRYAKYLFLPLKSFGKTIHTLPKYKNP